MGVVRWWYWEGCGEENGGQKAYAWVECLVEKGGQKKCVGVVFWGRKVDRKSVLGLFLGEKGGQKKCVGVIFGGERWTEKKWGEVVGCCAKYKKYMACGVYMRKKCYLCGYDKNWAY